MDDSVKQYLIPGNDEFLVSYRGPLHLARQFVSYFFPSDIANNGDWKYRARIPGMRIRVSENAERLLTKLEKEGVKSLTLTATRKVIQNGDIE